MPTVQSLEEGAEVNKRDVLLEANSRLRLGEWFRPPDGTLIKVPPSGRLYVVTHHTDLRVPPHIKGLFMAKSIPRHSRDYSAQAIVIPGQYYEILDIPDNADPLDHWPRRIGSTP